MKTLLVVLLLGLGASAAQAQRFPAAQRTDSLRLRIVEKSGRLALEWLNAGNRFPGFDHGSLQLENVTLDDADLVVWYRTGKAGGEHQPDFSVRLRRVADGAVFSPGAAEWIELPGFDKPDRGLRRRAYTDVTEHVLRLGETYTFAITSRILLDVDCTAGRPAWQAGRLWPQYGIAAAGVTALVLGQVYNERTKTYSRLYEQRWSEGATSAAAQPDFDAAGRAARQARAYTYAGAALLAVDAVWLAAKWRTLRRQQRTYDRYCAPPPGTIGSVPDPAVFRWQVQPGGLQLTLYF